MSAQNAIPLNPEQRERSLERLAAATRENPLDVLVIGGGGTGAGAVFDAATRGLDVAIVEAEDWASGTSSRSSKLMHGGLRYLQMLDFALVHEALRERDLLLRHTAPHLVRPISFVFPFFKKVIERAYIGAGVALYDTLASASSIGRKRAVPFHRHLSHSGMLKHFPSLDGDVITGALEYYDAEFDDARMAMMLVRSAVQQGAAAASRTRVISYLHEGKQVIGVRVRDEVTGTEYDVHARATILAGGVWTQEQQELAGSDTGLKVLASKGVHIVVPRERISAAPDTGIITQTEKSVLFIIPWDEYWVIGTTDTPWKLDVSKVTASGADIDYILEHANAVLSEDLTRQDVIGVYAGLRPLLQPVKKGDGASTKVSREHTVMEVEPGLSAIAGGKWTTFRVMAEDVVDFAIRDLFPGRPSLTESIPVIGGQGFAQIEQEKGSIAAQNGFDEIRTDRLLFRYGTLLREVLDLIDADSSLATPLEHAPRYLRAEVLYAVRAEGALHLADVMLHRTRIEYEVADRGIAAADEVAAIIAPELGWDEQRTQAEIAAYRAHMEARLAAEQTDSDEAAVAALDAAPSPVPAPRA